MTATRLYPEPKDRTADVDVCVQCDRTIEASQWRTSAGGDPVHMMCARYVHGGARPCDDGDPED